jgi:hypothetical protein
MEQAVQFNVMGIKCDTPTCDYNDPSVKVEDYKDWVNKPCPKCGGNLLTEQDYATVQLMMQITAFANQHLPAPDPNEKKVRLAVELDGSGTPKLTPKDMTPEEEAEFHRNMERLKTPFRPHE